MTAVVSTLLADKRLAESGLEIPLRFIRPCLKNYPDWRVDIEGHKNARGSKVPRAFFWLLGRQPYAKIKDRSSFSNR